MKEISSLIDKVILIGITVLDKNEKLITQIQVYGPVIRVSAEGIIIKRNITSTEFAIPPDFEHITEAEEGEYRLRSSGEVVVNPDYISSWTLRSGSKEEVEYYTNFGFKGYIK